MDVYGLKLEVNSVLILFTKPLILAPAFFVAAGLFHKTTMENSIKFEVVSLTSGGVRNLLF